MSEDVKPRIFHTTMLIGSNDESWISSKNKDFIDKIFYKEKFKSIELEPTLQLMKEIGDALEFYSNKTKLDCGEMASVKLEKYRKFLEGIK